MIVSINDDPRKTGELEVTSTLDSIVRFVFWRLCFFAVSIIPEMKGHVKSNG